MLLSIGSAGSPGGSLQLRIGPVPVMPVGATPTQLNTQILGVVMA